MFIYVIVMPSTNHHSILYTQLLADAQRFYGMRGLHGVVSEEVSYVPHSDQILGRSDLTQLKPLPGSEFVVKLTSAR